MDNKEITEIELVKELLIATAKKCTDVQAMYIAYKLLDRRIEIKE